MNKQKKQSELLPKLFLRQADKWKTSENRFSSEDGNLW